MTRNPKVNQALEKVQTVMEQKKLYTSALKLAHALCFVLKISEDGRELVHLLTSAPQVRTNREAVAHWAMSQLADPVAELGSEMVPNFVTQLKCKLRSVSDIDPS